MSRNTTYLRFISLILVVLVISVSIIPSITGLVRNRQWVQNDDRAKDSNHHQINNIRFTDETNDAYYDVKIVYTTNDNDTQCEPVDTSMYTRDANEKKICRETTTERSDVCYHFYGETNRPFYVVRVSSPHEINLSKYVFFVHQNKTCNRSTRGTFSLGIFVTNKTEVTQLGGYAHRWQRRDKINYFHCQVGKHIDYTYENMPKFATFRYWVRASHYDYINYIYPPGTWYFVFTGSIFDLDENDMTTEVKVWMNFSGNCSDMEVTGFDWGEPYYLWYGEFEANLSISKHPDYRRMLNGRYHFQINHTFLYNYLWFPLLWQVFKGFGFWKVFWKTPHGRETMRLFAWRSKDWAFRGLKKVEKTPLDWKLGIGESGEYTLRTSYLDCLHNNTEPIYFVGLDVALP